MTDSVKIKIQDQHFMRLALRLAAKGRGQVSPNPMVGCVIVKNGKTLAQGYHQKFGGPHAEIVALQKCKGKATGATVYVTLEPCHHFGKTPPCVDALLAAGVKRVVIAMRDPNPLTSGRSILKLKKARVSVTVGVCQTEAQTLNRGFCKFIQTGLPHLIVKVAQSRDGKIAAKAGVRTQITATVSQKYVQDLRQKVDAVLVGRKTVLSDDPVLNVRRSNAPQPARIVLDSQLRTPLSSRLFSSVGGPVILCASQNVDPNKLARYQVKKIQVLLVATNQKGQLLWRDLLQKLAKDKGVLSVLVEGGAAVLASLVKTKYIDEWHMLTAPHDLGVAGVSLFNKQPKFLKQKAKIKILGKDKLTVYKFVK